LRKNPREWERRRKGAITTGVTGKWGRHSPERLPKSRRLIHEAVRKDAEGLEVLKEGWEVLGSRSQGRRQDAQVSRGTRWKLGLPKEKDRRARLLGGSSAKQMKTIKSAVLAWKIRVLALPLGKRCAPSIVEGEKGCAEENPPPRRLGGEGKKPRLVTVKDSFHRLLRKARGAKRNRDSCRKGKWRKTRKIFTLEQERTYFAKTPKAGLLLLRRDGRTGQNPL